jgi:hypothetical protein
MATGNCRLIVPHAGAALPVLVLDHPGTSGASQSIDSSAVTAG